MDNERTSAIRIRVPTGPAASGNGPCIGARNGTAPPAAMRRSRRRWSISTRRRSTR
jgi:hypothetical protein